jgi:hypothetical protein
VTQEEGGGGEENLPLLGTLKISFPDQEMKFNHRISPSRKLEFGWAYGK